MSTRTLRTDRGGLETRVADLGAAVTVLLSVVTGVVTYGALPNTLRVHYTLGTGVYYGPETLAKGLVLAGTPVLMVAVYAGLRAFGVALARREPAFERVRPVYDLTAAGVLVAVLATEALVLGLALV